MNLLALSQRARQEMGIAGTGPSTTAGQAGILQRVISWVIEADLDVQNKHDDWGWMRQPWSMTTVDGQATYPLGTGAGTTGIDADTLGEWVEARGIFRVFPTATGNIGETSLGLVGYDAWRNTYEFGANRYQKSQPVAVAIGPDKSINLGPPPTGDYTITGDYFAASTPMAVDADVPAYPTKYHLIAVYGAMVKYGGYEGASEVYDRGARMYDRMLSQLEATRLPRIRRGRALA